MNKNQIKNFLINLPGWHTSKKIIVFESDDWGTIRMASRESYKRLLKKGYPVDKCAYNKNDALETNEDLEKLATVLLSVKDKNNNPAKFTLDNIVANPDFEKIKQSEFNKYYLEPFTSTLKRYKNTDRVLSLYKKGITEGVFQPQFHGREHININRWLVSLQDHDKRFIDAFNENMFSIAVSKPPKGRRGYLDSFGENYKVEFESYDKIIKDGTDLFEKIWGFRSETFIAPCYIWSNSIEPILKEVGIDGLQGTHVQRVPVKGEDYKIRKKYHFTGQKNKHNQYYLIRNVFFEPSEKGRSGLVEQVMKEIEVSFKYKKPAIISSHRVNFIGSIQPDNRDKNLKLLSDLLKQIVIKYPDVEFMSSDELLMLIKK